MTVKIDSEVFFCRRVLHRIVHQVQQRARNRLAIDLQLGQIVVDLLLELETTLLDFVAIRFERATHQVGYIGFAEAVLSLAGLDTGEVENIVDEGS
jgi:hypothetical protein